MLNVTDTKLLVPDPNPFVLRRDVLFPFASAGGVGAEDTVQEVGRVECGVRSAA